MKAQNDIKKTNQTDWHKADIVAAVRKKCGSLRKLSVSLGYEPTTLANVMQRPWPKGEERLADALGLKPWDIWPSRYNITMDDKGNITGVPNRGSKGRKTKIHITAGKKSCNVKDKKAA
jgi:Ner family transcriptional regulator